MKKSCEEMIGKKARSSSIFGNVCELEAGA
jgi:hypothetical protein